MEYEEAKALIVEGLTKKQKIKSKFYFNDLAKILELKPRVAKKLINQMVRKACWSTGPVAAPPCTVCRAPANRLGPSTKTNPRPLASRSLGIRS